MTIYFSSDPHYSHKNIIKYCNRAFSSVEEMDAEMIRRHNSVVSPTDEWYCLGDFAFVKTQQQVEDLLAQLNGRKHLIVGNHDPEHTLKAKGWDSVHDILELKVPELKLPVVLCHYAMVVWNRSFHGSYHFFGHSHGMLKVNSKHSVDVGVDCWDFYPVSVKQIMDREWAAFGLAVSESGVVERLSSS